MNIQEQIIHTFESLWGWSLLEVSVEPFPDRPGPPHWRVVLRGHWQEMLLEVRTSPLHPKNVIGDSGLDTPIITLHTGGGEPVYPEVIGGISKPRLRDEGRPWPTWSSETELAWLPRVLGCWPMMLRDVLQPVVPLGITTYTPRDHTWHNRPADAPGYLYPPGRVLARAMFRPSFGEVARYYIRERASAADAWEPWILRETWWHVNAEAGLRNKLRAGCNTQVGVLKIASWDPEGHALLRKGILPEPDKDTDLEAIEVLEEFRVYQHPFQRERCWRYVANGVLDLIPKEDDAYIDAELLSVIGQCAFDPRCTEKAPIGGLSTPGACLRVVYPDIPYITARRVWNMATPSRGLFVFGSLLNPAENGGTIQPPTLRMLVEVDGTVLMVLEPA